ncbi:hypothetical protein [Streptacidiphilus jiangxiensis]|uniref:Uncharacterized protein n=1 Tax=Streptacidiphilus jiangxiensis TaxID=235985 RepID=A0A1H7MCH7_STRJI|nr:hypothetical protein [Streptacidiphilus jiangxiensis]SEL08759.1 hypothetical protein SAMN05414137_105298 [Streptacidiphilus jiangxiensis]
MGGLRVVGRWLHLLPLLAGLLAVGYYCFALTHVGEQDALLRTYRQAQPCRADQSVADGCYAWFPGRVTRVQQPTAQDAATVVTVRFTDGQSARLELWRPPASFDGLGVGEAASVGTVRLGWFMDLRRDVPGAVMHGPDYPGFWDAVFVNDAVFGVAFGLPLVLWGLFGLLRPRGRYPWWALCMAVASALPAINAGAEMDDAPHLFAWGAYLPTAVAAAVGLLVGLIAPAVRRALPTSPGWSPWSSGPR